MLSGMKSLANRIDPVDQWIQQRAVLLKELMWIKNGENLLDFNPDTAPNPNIPMPQPPAWVPTPALQPVKIASTPQRAPQTRSKPGHFPFSAAELLALKRSYYDQPNPLQTPTVIQEATKDSQTLMRMSALSRDGLVKGSSVKQAPEYIQSDLFRDLLHQDIEEAATKMRENRADVQIQCKKLAKV